jgi:hypothetical protein
VGEKSQYVSHFFAFATTKYRTLLMGYLAGETGCPMEGLFFEKAALKKCPLNKVVEVPGRIVQKSQRRAEVLGPK